MTWRKHWGSGIKSFESIMWQRDYKRNTYYLSVFCKSSLLKTLLLFYSMLTCSLLAWIILELRGWSGNLASFCYEPLGIDVTTFSIKINKTENVKKLYMQEKKHIEIVFQVSTRMLNIGSLLIQLTSPFYRWREGRKK